VSEVVKAEVFYTGFLTGCFEHLAVGFILILVWKTEPVGKDVREKISPALHPVLKANITTGLNHSGQASMSFCASS